MDAIDSFLALDDVDSVEHNMDMIVSDTENEDQYTQYSSIHSLQYTQCSSTNSVDGIGMSGGSGSSGMEICTSGQEEGRVIYLYW